MPNSRRKPIEPMSNFNLTSLMDVTFILLIAFMIVAPSLKHGLELDLPEVNAEALEQDESKIHTVVIQKVRPEEDVERIYLDEKQVTLTDLQNDLAAMQGGGKKVNVNVETDAGVPSERLLQVIAAIQKAGIESIGIPTEPARDR